MCWVRQDWCRQPGDDDDENSGDRDCDQDGDQGDDHDDQGDEVLGQARMEQGTWGHLSSTSGPWRPPVFLR